MSKNSDTFVDLRLYAFEAKVNRCVAPEHTNIAAFDLWPQNARRSRPTPVSSADPGASDQREAADHRQTLRELSEIRSVRRSSIGPRGLRVDRRPSANAPATCGLCIVQGLKSERRPSDLLAVGCCWLVVESVGDPSHGALPVDEVGQEVVDVEFVEERGLFVGPEFDVGTFGAPVQC